MSCKSADSRLLIDPLSSSMTITVRLDKISIIIKKGTQYIYGTSFYDMFYERRVYDSVHDISLS